jgi:hypothetical protein
VARPPSVPRGWRAGFLLAPLFAGTAILPEATSATDGGVVLATHVLSSVAVDLDGDGSKEIVAVSADPNAPGTMWVGAWGVRAGAWVKLGQDAVAGWDAAAQRSRTAHLSEATAALLIVGDRDGDRVVVAVGRPYADGTTPGSCCLSFGAVRLVEGQIRFEPIPGDLGSAESITVVDLEADGRDELLVSLSIPDDDGQWAQTFTLLRHAGDGYAAEPVDVPDESAYFNLAVDIDGIPGDELLFMAGDGTSLIRATSSKGSLQFETSTTDGIFDGRVGGWIVGAVEGDLVLVSERSIVKARWPASGEVERTASIESARFPTLYVVGSGRDARIVEVLGMEDPSDQPGIRVYGQDLSVDLEQQASESARKLWRTITDIQNRQSDVGDLWPEIGVIPGGLSDGGLGLLGIGQALAMTSDGRPEVRDAAQLVGGQVIGLAGPQSGWIAHGVGWYGLASSAYLGASGTSPAELAGSRVTVIPTGAVLGADGRGEIDASLEGAVLLASPEGPRLFAGPDGFRAIVAGDPGTRVVTSLAGRSSWETIDNDSVTIEINPAGARDKNWRQTVGLLVVSPSGIAQTLEWDLTTLRVPPEVTAASSFDLFDARATVEGTVEFGTSVTVDGHAVATTADGTYRVAVDASPWPHDVAVVARDPLGTEVVRRVEVVGFVDVRALPWVPIIIVLTVVAAVVLFVRTPSLRPADRPVPDGDGRLEEIDG